ncbi:MAG: GGDEF domain-containing protein [Myxococcota bacterium]|nr:GGDEF domain-containing protein [Myxococcota bacterium]
MSPANAHSWPISPALAAALACLVSVTGWWMLEGRDDWQQAVTRPLELTLEANGHANHAMQSMEDHLQSGLTADRVAVDRSTTRVQATLEQLIRESPGLEPSIRRVRTAMTSLAQDDLVSASTAAVATLALDRARIRIARSHDELYEASRQQGQRYMVRAQGFLLLSWAASLILVALSTSRARTARELEQRTMDDQTEAMIHTATRALERARQGQPISDLIPMYAAQELFVAIQNTECELTQLRTTHARMRQRTTFTYELVDALDLADNESEVLTTVSRAAQLAMDGGQVQLYLSDAPTEKLYPREAGAGQVCTVTCASSCPATRKGRTLYHDPQGGLARCPRLLSDQTAVTCSPVTVNGQASGVIQLAADSTDDHQVEALESIAIALGARLGVLRNLAEHTAQASTDELTGLANRRAFNERMDELDADDGEYTLVAADLDHFKFINDTFGHATGDRCLQIFARVLREACRATDLPARIGGEEFVVVLPGVGAEAGARVAERIREILVEASQHTGQSFTTSLGVASSSIHGQSARDVLRSADEALYTAKREGRDKVCVAPHSVVLDSGLRVKAHPEIEDKETQSAPDTTSSALEAV